MFLRAPRGCLWRWGLTLSSPLCVLKEEASAKRPRLDNGKETVQGREVMSAPQKLREGSWG